MEKYIPTYVDLLSQEEKLQHMLEGKKVANRKIWARRQRALEKLTQIYKEETKRRKTIENMSAFETYIRELYKLVDICDSELMWDGENFPEINCSDLFYWGLADSESIPPEALPELKQALNDIKNHEDGWLLYCARTRKMRPQGAAYFFLEHEYWHLFDECGSEREINKGNPYKIGEYKAKEGKK